MLKTGTAGKGSGGGAMVNSSGQRNNFQGEKVKIRVQN